MGVVTEDRELINKDGNGDRSAVNLTQNNLTRHKVKTIFQPDEDSLRLVKSQCGNSFYPVDAEDDEGNVHQVAGEKCKICYGDD